MANTPPLNFNFPMVDPETGKPTPFFMRWWQEQIEANALITDLSTPAAVAAVLDILGPAAQGQVIFRGATLWELLSPDVSGKILSTNGPGADPSWETISQILDDTIGNTRGSVLYRGATGWSVLTPGTAGHVLTTNGPSADPSWAAGGGGGGGGPASFAKATKPGNVLTTYNSGSPTENAYNATHDIWRIHHTTNQGVSLALKTGLADGDTVILKTRCFVTGANFHTIGLAYGENSSSKRVFFGISFGGQWRKQFWNNFTFVSESTVTPAGLDSRYVNVAPWLYWKASRSGTTITVEYSFNGLFWYPLGTGTSTENGMADVDEVGIVLYTTNTSGQTNYIELWGLDSVQQDEYGA